MRVTSIHVGKLLAFHTCYSVCRELTKLSVDSFQLGICEGVQEAQKEMPGS